MRSLLLLSLLLIFAFPNQNPAVPQEVSAVVVLGYKWARSRQVLKQPVPADTGPARGMIPANKNYQRNARVNDPAGARDPNEDTIDGRSAAIEKIVQESRTPAPKPVDGFAYQVKVQNASTKIIEILFFEYQFMDPSNPATVTRRQFLCGVNIRPDKGKELQAFSLSGPSDVVSAGTLAGGSENVFQEKVVINRVEYADGSIWQRKDWNFGEIKMGYQRAVGSPWQPGEMCRGL